jgi:hypothetical protein
MKTSLTEQLGLELARRWAAMGVGVPIASESYLLSMLDSMSAEIPGVEQYIRRRIEIIQEDCNRLERDNELFGVSK